MLKFCPFSQFDMRLVVLNKTTFEYSYSISSIRRKPTNRATHSYE